MSEDKEGKVHTDDPNSSAESLPLVWVSVGKSQHAAFLVQEGRNAAHENLDEQISTDQCLVRWSSNDSLEWVQTDQIQKTLSPRKRGSQNMNTAGSDLLKTNRRPTRVSTTPGQAKTEESVFKFDTEPGKAEVATTISPKVEAASMPLPNATFEMKTSGTSNNGNETNIESDDDEVEFMFTLAKTPPRKQSQSVTTATTATPATKKSKTLQNEDSPRKTDPARAQKPLSQFFLPRRSSSVASSKRSKTPLPEKPPTDNADHSNNATMAEESELTTARATQPGASSSDVDTKSEPPRAFPLIQSAYIQTLAEISHFIMNDGRWRVGQDSVPLFQWEFGDDLSAVLPLKRLYVPPQQFPREDPCNCLLCRSKKSQNEVSEQNLSFSANWSNKDNSNSLSVDGEMSEHKDEDVRWLYLYCRLFFRRGPWFRLDDIYERYYKPANETSNAEKVENEDQNESDSPDEPQNKGNKSRTSDSAKVVFCKERLPLHLSRVKDMLRDLRKLVSSGLIRSFEDEKECGLTVGQSVITQDMRSSLLQKLGLKKQSKSNYRTQTAQPKSIPSSQQRENLVWKQMNRQQSIFASLNGNSSAEKSERLLPVIKHVNCLMFEKISVDIIKSCCGLSTTSGNLVGYLPSAVRKAHEPGIRQQLTELATECGLNVLGTSCFSCWRMRESPSLCLRRACRLFLCATGGPGDMRSDETNGWKSVLPYTEGAICLPLQHKIRPPGINSWCFVSYHGSMARFGLSSVLFRKSYRPIENGSQIHCQVFHTAASFRAWELSVELRTCVDYWIEVYELMRYEERQQARKSERDESGSTSNDKKPHASVDFLKLLTIDGLDHILRTFLVTFPLGAEQLLELKSTILEKVQEETQVLFHSSANALTECERILVTLGILTIHILQSCARSIDQEQASKMSASPWLRHLWCFGCLAYILWDIIPIMERREMYGVAVKALYVLLTGCIQNEEYTEYHQNDNSLSILFLSRRARGKALDRLIIDHGHLERQKNQDEKDKGRKKQNAIETAARLVRFCESVLQGVVQTSQISFSCIRGVARRLKRPLHQTLEPFACLEAKELDLRLKNESETDEEDGERYTDWTPITDKVVANAIASDRENAAGTRCVFIGEEDASLNVEELAMENYKKGFPVDGVDKETNGGWLGWHDEGGHVRALFRILCSAPLLGVDWGCSSRDIMNESNTELDTIHLSPYQGAPFDLHVGFSVQEASEDKSLAVPGFYSRRSKQIEEYLAVLSKTSRQELCDAVHDAIEARFNYAKSVGSNDPALEPDMKNLRTLSLIASGCGGQQLASIFRSLLFDYRHYSGGLPDCTLCRALVKQEDGSRHLVDLSEWIGESLSSEFQAELKATRGAEMLADEEFLGCSKVGDSGNNRNSRGRNRSRPAGRSKGSSAANLPKKLELTYKGLEVEPECMMVEVKSSNDRLDGRQEDWLNILDRHGNARVCKFEDTRKRSKRGESSSSSQPRVIS